MNFVIDPAFFASSHRIGVLDLCEMRLQDDARWPWIILVPRAPGLVEIEDLKPRDRAQLTEEIICGGAAVRAIGQALGMEVEKLNVGALGNITPQLHVHVIGRCRGDPAWPGPAWGYGTGEAYDDKARATAILAVKDALRI
ncbi:HIT domain-containing protein [Caulobacter sp. NIBR2454]|uniref:HIT domain-containing protein n=1 Tax=Caulobacter sp. NIBR2454 TaxID=3015996 RepID=UPI0022B7006B|nr:HIT domain-containing protein [Caulobacter sp. NIBR2454]